jgi:hypothetical protein
VKGPRAGPALLQRREQSFRQYVLAERSEEFQVGEGMKRSKGDPPDGKRETPLMETHLEQRTRGDDGQLRVIFLEEP